MDIRELPRILFNEFGRNVRQRDDGLLVAETAYGVYLTFHPEAYGTTAVSVWFWEERIGGGDRSLCIRAGDGCAGFESRPGERHENVWIDVGRLPPWDIPQWVALAQCVGALIVRAATLIQSGAFEMSRGREPGQ